MDGIHMFGRKRHLALLFTALSPMTTFANNFNYSSVEFRVGASPASYGVEGNLTFTENTHFIGRLDSQFQGDYDIAVGVGFNGPATGFADIFGQMLLHNIKSSDDKFIGNQFIPELNIGARIWFLDNIETNVKIGQLVYSETTEFTYSFGGRFHSTDQLSIGANIADNGIYGSQLIMGARFMF